ncbi:hypothetical protein B0H11DRAFT_18677 [Mycena galericulata]|nr:hypothetical protein B0H11DRAFT_18677 [Mycena galericulata]
MVQQTSAHSFAPNFPDEAVQRYPSLTLALGDNYPGRRAAVIPQDNASESVYSDQAPMSFNGLPSSMSSPMPDEAVERYPGLALALGLNYPGRRAAAIPQYHASESLYSYHDAPTSFNGMPSSMSSPMSPLTSLARSEPRSMPSASISDVIMEATATTRSNIPAIHEAPITIPDMISRDTSKVSGVSPTWFSASDDFIPICNALPSFPLEGKPINPCSSTHTTSRDGLPLPLRRAKRIKTYECDRCDMGFPRSSDLRTHQNVHAGEERFTCEFPNCKKKFGVRANLLRHSVMHQIPKTVSDRSTSRVKFAPPEKVPHVHSDTVPMCAGIVWDNEGPFARRQEMVSYSNGSSTAQSQYTRQYIAGARLVDNDVGYDV